MEYPIEFDKCPNCGRTKRIVQEEVQPKIEDGRFSAGTVVPALVLQVPLVDSQTVSKILGPRPVEILFGACDICADCGTLYLFHMSKQEMMMNITTPPTQTPPRPGGKR